MRDRKRVDLEERGSGKELAVVDRAETVTRIYFMRQESIFNKNIKMQK